MSKKVAVIAGGLSSERDVSLVTGKAFTKALDELGQPYVWVEAGRDLPEQLMKIRPDVALLALHGKYGEDGTVQGICEYLRIPYTGSGVMASALIMSKYTTKKILNFHHIPTPRFEMYFHGKTEMSRVKPSFSLPWVVKPSREGSTVGISIVRKESDLPEAIQLASQHDREILVEEFIDGMEATVGVFMDRALTPIEIVPKTGFYDYKTKYTAGQTEYILPARLSDEITKTIKDFALQAHHACQARTYSRVDFRITPEGMPYVLEINSLPGCTPTSLLPKAAHHDGILFKDLVKTLIEQASLDYEGVR